jgi:hypothetical protein
MSVAPSNPIGQNPIVSTYAVLVIEPKFLVQPFAGGAGWIKPSLLAFSLLDNSLRVLKYPDNDLVIGDVT